MSDSKFNVVFSGEILDGFSVDSVKANLAKRFKLSPNHLEKLFSGKEVVVKRGLPKEAAQKLQAVLAGSGAISTARAASEVDNDSSHQSDPADESVDAPNGDEQLPKGEWSADTKKTVRQIAGAVVVFVAFMAVGIFSVKTPISQSSIHSPTAIYEVIEGPLDVLEFDVAYLYEDRLEFRFNPNHPNYDDMKKYASFLGDISIVPYPFTRTSDGCFDFARLTGSGDAHYESVEEAIKANPIDVIEFGGIACLKGQELVGETSSYFEWVRQDKIDQWRSSQTCKGSRFGGCGYLDKTSILRLRRNDAATHRTFTAAQSTEIVAAQNTTTVSEQPKVKYPYVAYVTCGYSGRHINALACFKNTDFKLKNNGRTRVYQTYELSQFPDRGRGLEIELSESFALTAKNSDDTLVLGVDIRDRSGNSLFQDQVGQYGVIKVAN
jgi:hypothetical protein